MIYLHYVKDFYLDHLPPQMMSIEEKSGIFRFLTK